MSVFSMTHGQTRMQMSLLSLPGLGREVDSGGWLLRTIVLHSSFLTGPFTDRAAAGRLRLRTNFLTLLSTGLEIQIHGSERGGRRAKDWRSSSRIVEPCWFWTAWSRSKIRLVHKKDGYVSLRFRRF